MDPKKFKNYCEHFQSVSDGLQDGWRIIQSKTCSNDNFYLMKRVTRISHPSKKTTIEDNQIIAGLEDADFKMQLYKDYKNPLTGHSWKPLEKEADSYKLKKLKHEYVQDPCSRDSADFPDTVSWEYHILFNESYGVPVLYFNCWKTDGSILSFDGILSWSHSEMKAQLLENRWQSITQQEHPILGRPFYMLHPCKTAEYLNTIQGDSRVNPLVTWLSSFGGAVGLNLPPEYGMNQFIENPVI